MSYYKVDRNGPRDPRAEHEKAWRRAQATAWDAKWRDLSPGARRAYLAEIKPPTKEGSQTQPSSPSDGIPPAILQELVDAGFVKVDDTRGRKSARVLPLSAAYDFSSRLRSIARYRLLDPAHAANLAAYVKHAFYNQGELVVNRVLSDAGVTGLVGLDEGLQMYVASRRWPGWALGAIKSKAARPVFEALRDAPGPVRLDDLPGLVGGFKPDEVREALTDLIVRLAAFEDVDPVSLDLIAGLLPSVRKGLEEAGKPRKRPPLVVCKEPVDIGPPGGLAVSDLRAFLLEVASEPPRLRQDGGPFQKEMDRFFEALPPRPAWLDDLLRLDPEARLDSAYRNAQILKFVEREQRDKATTLNLSGKGRTWLALGLEEQYGKVYDHLRATRGKNRHDDYDSDYEDSYGDSKFLGVPISVIPARSSGPQFYSYYDDVKPEQRDALREALRRSFDALPAGVFVRWDSALDHLSFGDDNPLVRVGDPAKSLIYLDRRQVPRLSEQVEKAGRLLLDAFLISRLLMFDAVRPAIDAAGKLCVARLPRLDGFFGRPYDAGKDPATASTRVIVQPDFSVVVIGLDPAPAAELAPIAERAGGHAGTGVLTFKITRASVIRAAGQGLNASAIVARLRKHASVEVPENVVREVREWAGWVKLVNVRPMMIVRCPDPETVARVVSALGKKAERVADRLVALHLAKLSPADRAKLQEQGVLITDAEIDPPPAPEAPAAKPAAASASSVAPKKKRGRPPKPR